jgi:predicted amidohydrolase YtcJ
LQGITRDTPSPPGGQIDKDPQGEPTGIVRELALDQVQRLIESTLDTNFTRQPTMRVTLTAITRVLRCVCVSCACRWSCRVRVVRCGV